jgi:hypothetical protein
MPHFLQLSQVAASMVTAELGREVENVRGRRIAEFPFVVDILPLEAWLLEVTVERTKIVAVGIVQRQR